jgi:hypothetical protein
MSIPNELIDKTLVSGKYASYVYIFCIFLRFVLGYLILNKKINNMFIYLLSAFVILNFSIKRNEFIKTNTKTWKIYGRTIGAYSLLILNTYFNNDLKQKEYNIGGLIVIIDALLGIESRYIASNTKC